MSMGDAELGQIGGSETTPQTPSIRLPPLQTSEHADDSHEKPSTDALQAAFAHNHEAVNRNMMEASRPRMSNDSLHLMHDLHIKTDGHSLRRQSSVASSDLEPRLRLSASAASLTQRMPSVRSWLHSTAGSVSPGSVISSPQIAAMLDITPLPSPTITPLESWRALVRSRSRASSTSSRAEPLPPPIGVNSSLSPSSPRKKPYFGLHGHFRQSTDDKSLDEESSHHRSRSISDYVPEPHVPFKSRQHAVSTAGQPVLSSSRAQVLQREEYLATQRGITPVATPNVSAMLEDVDGQNESEHPTKIQQSDIYHATSISRGNPRAYEPLRQLGQGTFSKVYLAVRLLVDRKESVDYRQESTNMAGLRARSRRLVAVKVVEPGPAGGADADRIETSLKREVELMKVIQHPSIVHLKAFGKDSEGRALLVMNFCPGGDLFDLTSKQPEVLTPSLVRRIFSELVSAVRYLHQKYIVHRDIKLENVLLNIPVQVHSDVPDWQTLDRAVVTLTDLGLSRTIPLPPESPLLETRCGSEDYAAPEILMGQPYDGRQTDAWALGVLLYALMECRLPFDPLPGIRGDPTMLKARTPHRIARCEWGWVRYGDEDNEWDPDKGKGLDGARKCVEGLLKRNTRRAPLSEIREYGWVNEGIQIDGGLRWVEEENL